MYAVTIRNATRVFCPMFFDTYAAAVFCFETERKASVEGRTGATVVLAQIDAQGAITTLDSVY